MAEAPDDRKISNNFIEKLNYKHVKCEKNNRAFFIGFGV